MNNKTLLYQLIYWRLATMQSNSLPWRDAIIEGRQTPGLNHARRLPAGSPCPYCESTSLTRITDPTIPVDGITYCLDCHQVHLVTSAPEPVEGAAQ